MTDRTTPSPPETHSRRGRSLMAIGLLTAAIAAMIVVARRCGSDSPAEHTIPGPSASARSTIAAPPETGADERAHVRRPPRDVVPVAAAGANPADSGERVVIRVEDGTGAPVAGVDVSVAFAARAVSTLDSNWRFLRNGDVFPIGGSIVATGADGRVAIDVPTHRRTAAFRVVIDEEPWCTLVRELAAPPRGELVLRVDKAVSITLRVVAADGGEFPWCTLLLDGRRLPIHRANGGTLTATGLPRAGGRLVVEAAVRLSQVPNAETACAPLEIAWPATEGRALDLGTVTVTGGASIVGRVTWPDGAPAALATVTAAPVPFTASPSRVHTDEDGRFRISSLAHVSYRLQISAHPEERPGIRGRAALESPAPPTDVDVVLSVEPRPEDAPPASPDGR